MFDTPSKRLLSTCESAARLYAYIVFTLTLFLRFAFPQKQSWSRETDLLARLAQLLVKLGTEAADKWFFKKLIYGQMQLASLLHSVAAHIPTVIVERNHAVAQTLFADGVEGTTDRFAEPCFSRKSHCTGLCGRRKMAERLGCPKRSENCFKQTGADRF